MQTGIVFLVKFGLDFAEHDLVDVEAALQTLRLLTELAHCLLQTAKVKTLVQVDLELASLELRLQTQVPLRLLTVSDASVVGVN